MQFEKRAVRLGDIRPSEQNPREEDVWLMERVQASAKKEEKDE